MPVTGAAALAPAEAVTALATVADAVPAELVLGAAFAAAGAEEALGEEAEAMDRVGDDGEAPERGADDLLSSQPDSAAIPNTANQHLRFRTGPPSSSVSHR